MKFRNVVAVLLCLSLCGLAYLAFAEDPNYAVGGDKNGLRVGKNLGGTKMDFIGAGTAIITSGTASIAVAVTGVGTADIVKVSVNEDLGLASESYGIPTANTVTIYTDTNPGTNLTVSYIVIGVP